MPPAGSIPLGRGPGPKRDAIPKAGKHMKPTLHTIYLGDIDTIAGLLKEQLADKDPAVLAVALRQAYKRAARHLGADSKQYKPNGMRECARRMRQMARAAKAGG